MSDAFRLHLDRIQRTALLAGALLTGVTFTGAFIDSSQFFYSYLFGWLFWLGLSLGCFLVTMIHYLTGGRWGYPTRRFLEAGFLVLPLMLALLIPIFFGLKHLYPWAQPERVAVDAVLQQRHAYQNSWGFGLRIAFFFAAVFWMTLRLRKLSIAQDLTSDAEPTRQARRLSGVGVVAYVLLASIVYIDWIMSLEPHWYSTMFPVIIIIGQVLIAYVFSVIMLVAFQEQLPIAQIVTRKHYHQLGNLLLTFVLFWTYVTFSQLLIIYSGDLPSEIDWYLHRITKAWKWVIITLATLHFAIPFLLLLFRAMKNHPSRLAILAVVLFAAHVVEMYWLVMPALHPTGISLSWMDFTAPLGIGCVWVSAFLWHLKSAPLLPQHDPGMQFAFAYEH